MELTEAAAETVKNDLREIFDMAAFSLGGIRIGASVYPMATKRYIPHIFRPFQVTLVRVFSQRKRE